MIKTGKYDFPGLRKAGLAGAHLLIASTGWGAWLLASPFRFAFNLLLEWIIELLANKGLVLFNLGAIYVNGEFDQSAFDDAMEEGLSRAKAPGLTAAQRKKIDDEVIKAFRKFGRVGNPS